MPYIRINSEHLQLAEPLMTKYYDFDSSMFIDEIQHCVENSGINYMNVVDGMVNINCQESFREHKELNIIGTTPCKKRIKEVFDSYFVFQKDSEEETITEDDVVYLCLTFMPCVYYKETNGLFDDSSIITDLDIEYVSILHHKIYPEMLSLYKMILESKTKKNRDSKITLTYKQDKIDINSCAWFLDDMEKYFKERFPDLTIEDINQLLPDNKGKGGRKFNNRITNNLIWGTYQLLYNHHSKFKNSKKRISEEICQFILDYLDCLEIQHDLILVNVRDWLKDMIKRGYTPQWDLPWRNAFSNIKEKQPKTIKEKLNTPLRRYDISNL